MKITTFTLGSAILLGLLFCAPTLSYATHAMGADLTYECISNNEYLVRLSVYRDCEGTTASTSAAIDIDGVSCGFASTTTVILNRVSFSEASPLCPTEIANSRCNGGTLPGVEVHVYEGVVTLPGACANWRLSYRLGNRNAAITNVNNAQLTYLYVDAIINNTNGLCNNSPTFTNAPVPYICTGQPFTYSHGVADSDGDSLVFTMVEPLDDFGDPLTYIAGYSAANPLITFPLNSFVFNGNTGQMDFTPNGIQNAVVAVRVDEYRKGVHIGSILRDMQMVTITCTNNTPAANAVSNVSGGVYSAGVFNTCANSTLNFTLSFSDSDIGDVLSASHNISTVLPGATVSTSGTNPVILNVSWPVPANPLDAYSIFVGIEDDACPINSNTSSAFTVRTQNVPITIQADNKFCANTTTVEVLQTTLGSPTPGSYTWSPSTGLSNASSASPTATVSSPITYTVTFTPSTGGNCPSIQSISFESRNIDVLATPNQGDYCGGMDPAVQLDAQMMLDGQPLTTVGPTTCHTDYLSRVNPTNSTQLFSFTNLPTGTVTSGSITVYALGDIDGTGSNYEGWELYDENGLLLDSIGGLGAFSDQCNTVLVRTIPLSSAMLSSWGSNGSINFTMEALSTVSLSLCTTDSIGIALEYCTTQDSYTESISAANASGTISNYIHTLRFDQGVPDANGGVNFTFCMTGDYGTSVLEYVDVYGEGNYSFGHYDGSAASYSDCGLTAFCHTITIPDAQWNAWNDDGEVVMEIRPSSYVDFSCLGNYSVVESASVDYKRSGFSPVTYFWAPTVGLSDPTIANPLASPPAPTTYTVTAFDGTCTVTQTVDINCGNVLSSDCAEFQATPLEGKGVKLQWLLQNTEPQAIYHIERSPDGIAFERQHSLEGQGAQTEILYEYIDPTARPNQTYYYRIWEETPTEYEQVCAIKAVETGRRINLEGLSISPNPTSGMLEIQAQQMLTAPLRVRILNTLGQVVHFVDFAENSALNTWHIDLSALPAASYFVELSTEDGARSIRTLIKR